MDHAVGYGPELTYFHRLKPPLYGWAGGGARFWTSQNDTGVLPYVETGMSFLIGTLGMGYAPGFLSDDVPDHSLHLFVGINVPLWRPKRGRLLYAMPYYRPVFPVGDSQFPIAHELGVLIKWSFTMLKRAEED